jgi:hypothetical protein
MSIEGKADGSADPAGTIHGGLSSVEAEVISRAAMRLSARRRRLGVFELVTRDSAIGSF